MVVHRRATVVVRTTPPVRPSTAMRKRRLTVVAIEAVRAEAGPRQAVVPQGCCRWAMVTLPEAK